MNKKVLLVFVALILLSSVNAQNIFTVENLTEVSCSSSTCVPPGLIVKTFNFSENPVNITTSEFAYKADTAVDRDWETIFTYEDTSSQTVTTFTFSLTYVNTSHTNPDQTKFVSLIEFNMKNTQGALSYVKNNILNWNRYRQNQWTALFDGDEVLNFNLVLSNATAIVTNITTTNGSVFTTNITGNYTANITSDSFANLSQLFDIEAGIPITVNLTAQKALIIDILDEETDQIITDENLTITIVGSTGAFVRNFTTDTGEISITNITLDDYILTYGGGKYRFRARFVTVTIDSQNLTLYTVRNTSSSLILFIVTDEKSKPVTNATLTVSRFFVNRNAFLPVDQERTDDNGETASYLIPNDVFYRFTIQKGDQVLFTALERKIFSSIVKITFPVLDDVIESMGVIRDDVFTNLSFNNDTNIVEFFWLSTSNIVETGCVQVLEKKASSQVLFGPVCQNAQTATVTINLTGNILNDTLYLAQGYIETNTSFSTYYTDQIEIFRARNIELFGLTGLFFSWVFIGAMFFLGIPVNFTIALVYTILSSVIVQAMGISYLSWTLIISFSIIGIVIAVVTKQ